MLLRVPLKFPPWLRGKKSACFAGYTGDVGSVPGSGSSPGRGNENPLHYSFRKNPTDRGAWQGKVHGVPKSWTRLTTHRHHLPSESGKSHTGVF